MKREIIITSDGSTTIYLPDWDEQYHSKHGAIQEAYHVFIKSGLALQTKPEVSILEIGFGTGLNSFITFLENKSEGIKKVNYVGVEAYPVIAQEVAKLNYVAELKAEKYQAVFDKMHDFSWDKKHEITPTFSLTKRQQFFKDIDDKAAFDLIYFDAFAAEHQPDLWTEAIFEKMFEALNENGILVTYCAKGSVRRAMQAVGFTVERLAGPPGKREMLRATKTLA
ncbi:tRNA (5-methylaminomethyl-2-thiouridine)(34)-methyltransferase MnmD [Tenacibaculum finnmarkense]|uniref:tRNA (5-methylaminomethyl-2-thiouridine)(34)-methyltransferase MnmD n=1 Tax=Tenacibaculum finnmarkense TaxID=2781243 RepID=UPI001EFBBD54|nr:tRNA (5-methylaminomethyl-2-thiouridine)(34)-methyltransferase MnmD [Tenacibaculum finnmarkense genomovar ulcerans]MCG8748494.1 tRNA (5-methylaminomethyl-2-thiouridine)(34)-methyltransferase MnmD [Tenacibaculum finnmarkense]MCG8753609.1 tRNA (5-methylaminomethyl-2-thiouridine)(34)-methyltransferase MnmD [Tenacibaculum finnmarkense]MCG8782147.1 tRNA (5-methylaminomethyl-2-thiouridine)(34)-methyltransferase MnmD [Tenacibaculum finnmarkense]MCG8806895.1 tRNA (5-methylaminomethyl-2-thiouridine)(